MALVNLSANAGNIKDAGSIPGLGRSPGRGHCSPLQDSCLGNSMDRGTWRATVQRIAKSQMRLKRLSTQALAVVTDVSESENLIAGASPSRDFSPLLVIFEKMAAPLTCLSEQLTCTVACCLCW